MVGEALADASGKRECTKPYNQMCRLNQPVQVANQDHLLLDTKNRDDECVDNPYDSQPSQPAGENCYDRQDQQCEGNDETKQHVDVGKVRMGIRAHPKRHSYQRIDCAYNATSTTS